MTVQYCQHRCWLFPVVFSQPVRNSWRPEGDDWRCSLHGNHSPAWRGAQPRLQKLRGWSQPVWWYRFLFLPFWVQRQSPALGQQALWLCKVSIKHHFCCASSYYFIGILLKLYSSPNWQSRLDCLTVAVCGVKFLYLLRCLKADTKW